MNLNILLKIASNKLKAFKIKNPRLEAEILLSHALNKSREHILAHPEIKPSQTQIKKYNTLVKRRLKGEPIAYILSYKSFYGLDFIVNKHTLIPRPETELMVEEALKHIKRLVKNAVNSNCMVIDAGTGSGCVIISLAKNLSQNKNISFRAIDISKNALAIARKNAKRHKIININFIQGDLLEPIFTNPEHPDHLNSPIIITANLPYLTPRQIKNSPSIRYEPKIALRGGADGLKYYQRLFKQIKKLNKIIPSAYFILCEIDPGQSAKIKQLARGELPQSNFKIKKDLAGRTRLILISLSV